jgi:hypothetical protein
MLMKKITSVLLLFSLLLSGTVAIANDTEGSGHDVGISVGPSFALTDVGGAKLIGAPFLRDVNGKATRFAISAFYRYNVNKIFAVRANLMYGMLKGDDKYTDGKPPRYDGSGNYLAPDDSWFRARRNLNFETHIVEFQAMGEVNLKKYIHTDSKGSKERWAPYIAGGLGFFWFNPYTYYNGQKVKLKPLGTEGQNIGYKKPYSNFQFDLIALVGVKYNITERFSIAIEGVYHQTFSDYIDDVSGSYVYPQDLSKMSTLGQALQNRANDGRYPDHKFDYVEGQRDWRPMKADGVTPNPNFGQVLATGVGQQRGDKKNNDQFFHLQLTFAISLGEAGKKFGLGSCGKRNPYKVKFSCPKW